MKSSVSETRKSPSFFDDFAITKTLHFTVDKSLFTFPSSPRRERPRSASGDSVEAAIGNPSEAVPINSLCSKSDKTQQ